jgi:hypothetical protein
VSASLQTKFTPGPWYLEKAFRGKRRVSADPAEEISWHGLAEVVVVHGSNEPCEDGEANAHLIAAAPEMYEAMAEFVHRCEIGEVRSIKTYAKFKKVLAKANGGAE